MWVVWLNIFVNLGNKQLQLGRSTTDWAFDGQMDYIRLWDYALSSDEIFANYNSIIPEPASVVLLSLGALVLLPGARRRKHRRYGS